MGRLATPRNALETVENQHILTLKKLSWAIICRPGGAPSDHKMSYHGRIRLLPGEE
jgi:hypothetical protein